MSQKQATKAGAAGHSRAKTTRFQFGEFELDTDRCILLRNGREVALRAKCFLVLQQLVRHHGKLVSKQALMDRVWPGVIVTDSSLPQCLVDIRRALGDDAKTMIRTVPRRGYLFDLAVTEQEAGSRKHRRRTSGRPPTRPSSVAWLAAVTLLILVNLTFVAATNDRVAEPDPNAGTAPLPRSIAVLPFDDLSATGDWMHFADGLSEEILHLLAQNADLTVIARTSSFAFRDQAVDVPTIARKLGVEKLLEGSVRVDGTQARVTAQLIDAANGAHLWSRTFDVEVDDFLSVQNRIASSLAAALRGGPPRELPATAGLAGSAMAFEYLSRGHYFHGRRAPGDIERALEAFERAVEEDPQLADAWTGLAGALWVRAFTVDAPFEAFEDRILQALDRALVLQPDHAEAHIRMFQVLHALGRHEEAESHFGHALEHGRNSALVQGVAASSALARGDVDTAIDRQYRAVALDPLGYVNRGNLGSYLFYAGRYPEARIQLTAALDLNPASHDPVTSVLLYIAVLEQRYDEVARLAASLSGGPARDQAMAFLSHAAGETPRRDEALARLANRAGYDAAFRLAEFHARIGDTDEGFRWLNVATERLLTSRRKDGREMVDLEWSNSPFFGPLADDPRWRQWLARAGLGEADLSEAGAY